MFVLGLSKFEMICWVLVFRFLISKFWDMKLCLEQKIQEHNLKIQEHNLKIQEPNLKHQTKNHLKSEFHLHNLKQSQHSPINPIHNPSYKQNINFLIYFHHLFLLSLQL